ncbi:putative protein N(5)-glutamine methyltransferase [Longispora sp. K20-0274]|uniref:putative protein N(5)-glutamine methyltransferase n=1 Tax=Longispora sp. K20-0274 TaxID=3088255 RepID=UPI00399AD200
MSPALSHLSIVARLRAVGCVFAEDEARLLLSSAATPADLAAMVDRRVAGLPLEQVLGWAEFAGLRIAVLPGVFVPRRRTEFLATQATALARAFVARAAPPASGSGVATAPAGPTARVAGRPVVVDLCCGSGAVGTALVTALPGVELHAADIEPAAVRCARRNLGPAGEVHEGDLYAALPGTLRGRIDVLVCNAPYVPTGEIGLLPPEARLHEPHVTLDGGLDGLDVQRRVAAGAGEWLAPGGHLLVETSSDQAPGTLALFADAGLVARVATCEELSATVVIGTRPRSDENPRKII